MRNVAKLTSIVLPLLVACSEVASEKADRASEGVVKLALGEVPSDVGCVRVVAQGTKTVERSFDVQSGASATVRMTGLPIGSVMFLADAFDGACASTSVSSTPSWISDPTTVQVVSGSVANVVIAMRRNGRANVEVVFDDDAGVSCVAGASCSTNPSPCKQGVTSCGDSAPACVDGAPAPAGTLCSGGVCDGAGVCAPSCALGTACSTNPGAPCKTGTYALAGDGGAQCACVDSANAPNGTACISAGTIQSVCSEGVCTCGGCVMNGVCYPGTTRTACGWGGSACVICPSGIGFLGFCDSSTDPGHPFCDVLL